MTRSVMLDTNIVSDLLRHPRGRVNRKLRQVDPDAACVSIITAAELRFGATKVSSPRIHDQLSQLWRVIPVLPFRSPADEAYGTIRAALEKIGRPIGPSDLFIAAHALSLGLTLVTANVGEFSRIPGLAVENWLD
jgi:tRNA(fMet)-specific endonuclease VapC